MSEHLKEATELVHKLNGMGEKLADHWIVAMMLSSLPESYNPLITALEGRSEEDLKLEYVKGKLLDEWRRRCEQSVESENHNDKALRVAMQRQEGRGQGRSYVRTTKRECFYCHEEGHFCRDCPKLSALRRDEEDIRAENGESSSSRNEWRGNDRRNICFTTKVKTSNTAKRWLIDSGSTSHMTGSMGLLKNMMPCTDEVILADGKAVCVRAKGIAEFTGCDDSGARVEVKLKDVFYVPGLAANVLSVSRMIEAGFTVIFSSRSCEVCKDGAVLLTGERHGDLFYVKEA